MRRAATVVEIVTVVMALQGCVSTGPKLSPEEAAAKRVSTLTVYPDNQVAIKTQDKQGRVSWVWTSKPDRILALEIAGTLFNAKDIKRITTTEDRNSNLDIVVEFRDGHSRKTYAAYKYSDGTYSGTRWVECRSNKTCGEAYSLRSTAYQQDLGGILTAIDERYLLSASFERNPSFEYYSDYRAIPKGTSMMVATDEEYAQLETRKADMAKRWSAGAAERTKKASSVVKAAADKESVFWEKANRAGQFACTTTSYSCTNRGYSEATMLDCGTMRFALNELQRRGWIVADAKPQWVTKDIGEMCDHNVFYMTFKK